MLSLLTGVVAAATTTALGAFSEGMVTALVAYTAVKNTAKANINLKK